MTRPITEKEWNDIKFHVDLKMQQGEKVQASDIYQLVYDQMRIAESGWVIKKSKLTRECTEWEAYNTLVNLRKQMQKLISSDEVGNYEKMKLQAYVNTLHKQIKNIEGHIYIEFNVPEQILRQLQHESTIRP